MQLNSTWMSEIERWENINKDKVELHLHSIELEFFIGFVMAHGMCLL